MCMCVSVGGVVDGEMDGEVEGWRDQEVGSEIEG